MRHIDADLSYHRGEGAKQYATWRDPVCQHAWVSYRSNRRRPRSALAREPRHQMHAPTENIGAESIVPEIITLTKKAEVTYHDPSRPAVYEPPWPKSRPGSARTTELITAKHSRPGSAPVRRSPQKSASTGDIVSAADAQRIQRPASSAQFLSNLCYNQFGVVQFGDWDYRKPRSIRVQKPQRKKEDPCGAIWRVLPYGWVSRTEVEKEAAEAGLNTAEAVASVLVGRDAMFEMRAKRVILYEPEVLKTRQLDFRAWNPELKDEEVDRFLGAFALLYDPNVVEFVDVSNAGLVEAPRLLRCFPSLLHLDIGNNKGLMDISPLRMCSQLRTINLSGCSSLSDIAVLGHLEKLEGLDLSHCAAVVDVTTLAIGGQPPRGYAGCLGPELMGHPTLQWLSLSCCQRLDRGLDTVALCPKLEFVDLWNCEAAAGNIAHCVAIWRNVYPPMTYREVVWPRRKVVEDLRLLEGWSNDEYSEAFAEAQHGVEEKLTRAMRLSSGTGAIGADFRKKQQLKTAVDAGKEFEVESEAMNRAMEDLEAMNQAEPRPPAQRKRPMHLTPETFCRGVRALGIDAQALNGTQITDVFRLLDADKDGFIELDEFLKLDSESATIYELATVYIHLLNHFGSAEKIMPGLCEGLASPEELTSAELCSRLAPAGVAEDLAKRAAVTLLPPTLRGSEGIESAFDACPTLILLSQAQNFKSHLVTSFKTFDNAFKALDNNRSGSVSLQEFKDGLKEGGPLAWRGPKVSNSDASKVAESIFDLLDQDNSGVVGSKEFKWLADFSGSKVFQELCRASRLAERHCNAVPKAFRPDSAEKKKVNLKVPFRDFYEMWKSIVGQEGSVSARTCFTLFDTNVSSHLCEKEWSAFKALPHMKLAQDAAKLGEKIHKHFKIENADIDGTDTEGALEKPCDNADNAGDNADKEGTDTEGPLEKAFKFFYAAGETAVKPEVAEPENSGAPLFPSWTAKG